MSELFYFVVFVALFDSVDTTGIELIVYKIYYRPDTGDTDYRVKYAGADVCFGCEDPVYEVEVEDTYAQPVKRADHEQQQCDNCYHKPSF